MLDYECFSKNGEIVVDYYFKQVQVYEDTAIDLTFNKESVYIVYVISESDCDFEFVVETDVTGRIAVVNSNEDTMIYDDEEFDGYTCFTTHLTAGVVYYLYVKVNEQPSSGHVFVNINKI